MRERIYRARTGWMLGAAVMLAGAALAAQGEFSSANRQRGKAVVEYSDAAIHILAAYNYSQLNHDRRWLLIESAFSTRDTMTIHRDGIALRAPDGRDIPLASQRRVGEDVQAVRQLLQNAGVHTHDVVSYFNQRDRVENMQFFTLPFGSVVHDDFVVDRDRVVAGPLFFESPTGAWEDGTYALVIRYPKGTAELPIRLE